MESSIELPDELWNYIKEFIFYTNEQYDKVLRERVTLQKMKLAYAVDIYDNYIFKTNGIDLFIEYNEVYTVDDYRKIYFSKVIKLIVRLKELIKQKSSLNNLTKVKEFRTFLIKEFKRKEIEKIDNINFELVKSEKDKIFLEIQNSFMKYSLYFN
jgi:hypothetical protein